MCLSILTATQTDEVKYDVVPLKTTRLPNLEVQLQNIHTYVH